MTDKILTSDKQRLIGLIVEAESKISYISALETIPHIKTDLDRAYTALLDALEILYNGDVT